MNEVIRMENVIKMVQGARRTINDVSLNIHEKECVAISGVPGSGKSTLMRLIAGMEKPSDGKVFVMNKAVHEMDSDTAADFRNQNIGIIQQETGLMGRLTVLDNIMLPLVIQGRTSSQWKQTAKEQMKTLGILHIAHAYPTQLSDYETRIVSIARALMAQPKILLLYEVAAALSERETEQVMGVLNAISKYGDYTILSFSVIQNNGLRTNRTIQLNYGKIQEEGS